MPNQEQDGHCEIAACGAQLSGGSYYDLYYKRRVCVSCFKQAFDLAKDNGFGEWFENNYKKEDYPPEFWRSVGAFVDLSKAGSQDPYTKS